MRRLTDEEAMQLAEDLEPLFRNLQSAEDEAHWISAGKAAYRAVSVLLEEVGGGNG